MNFLKRKVFFWDTLYCMAYCMLSKLAPCDQGFLSIVSAITCVSNYRREMNYYIMNVDETCTIIISIGLFACAPHKSASKATSMNFDNVIAICINDIIMNLKT